MFTLSGLHPLPIDLWLTISYMRVQTCYQIGMVRSYILEQVKLKDFQHESFEKNWFVLGGG